MKKFLNEFKTFISRGNVLDMAIGVIVGGAFGKITTALVNNVLMPFIGLIFGGTDLTKVLDITIKPAVLDEAGNVVEEASVLGFGTFLNTVIDFVIVAFICFLIIKVFNKAKDIAEKKKKEEEAAAAAAAAAAEAEKAPELTADQQLLTEIRDLLKAAKK